MSSLFCLSLTSLDEPIVRFQKTIDSVKLDVIQADMSRPELGVKIILATGFPDGDETFENMVKKTPGALAAINGAYFDKKYEEADRRHLYGGPTGQKRINGNRVLYHQGECDGYSTRCSAQRCRLVSV
ncbi:hypothetical protein QPK87_32230 [Kamptonema cortianum]|nr:hypothetical protein [Geitlerinema splendidum]MDK3161191.1 hypothetical protein [Kamptonema cortianum]